MASYRYLIFIPFLFALSCAQVGTITGGVDDVAAPQPLMDKVEPKNESTNFTAQEVIIPFNEFIRLKDATTNIRMVPPHATINASIKGKELTLSWNEQLKENTTYAIYLNNAIQDITEANDTLIQYVFSTGSTIDSLTYSLKIVDAWSNAPIKKCIVALRDLKSNELQSFSESDVNGNVILRYLPSKAFKMVAFLDENADLELQKHEKRAFKGNQIIDITKSLIDTVPFRLYQPTLPAKITTAKYISNGTFVIGATTKIDDAQFHIDGLAVEKNKVRILASDSVLVFNDTREKTDIQLVVSTSNIIDTTKIRFNNYQKKRPVVLKPLSSSNSFAPSEDISFKCSDFIQSIDTSLVSVINNIDSSTISNYTLSFKYNQLFVKLDKKNITGIQIMFKDKAVVTTHGSTKLQVFDVKLPPKRKFGTIKVELEKYSSPLVLQLLKEGKLIQERRIDSSDTFETFEELVPDLYTFRVIEESTINGKWDVGNIEKEIQPEIIHYYSKEVKVRANWEIEVTLVKD